MNLFALDVRRRLDALGSHPGEDLDPGFDFTDYYTTRWSRALAVMDSDRFQAWLERHAITTLTELVLQTRLSAYAKRRRATVEGG